MMDEPIWRLCLVLPGNVETVVHGTQSVLTVAFEKFQESQWDENEKLTIEGFCNTADRATLKVCVKLSEVVSMSLLLEN